MNPLEPRIGTGVRPRLQHASTMLRTIRVRLTLWYVVLLAVILIAFCAFLYVSLSEQLQAEVDVSLHVAAAQVVAPLAVVDGQVQLDNQNPAALAAGIAVALYDRTGQQLVTSASWQPPPTLASALASAGQGQQNLTTISLSDGTRWRVLTLPVVANGRIVAILQVARSEQDVQSALEEMLTLFGIALPLTLLVAVAGGLFLAARALNPIDRITRTAATIGADDLSRRLDVAGNDEVGRLAGTFDRMLDRLDQALRRQRQFTADASHELRTPLTVLDSQLDVLLDRRRTPAEYARAVANLRADVQRMTQLVAELLTRARADAGRGVKPDWQGGPPLESESYGARASSYRGLAAGPRRRAPPSVAL